MPGLLLCASIFAPLVGAALLGILSLVRAGQTAYRWTALVFSLATLGLCLVVTAEYLAEPREGFFASLALAWLPETTGLNIQFSIGLDGLSLWLYALSALLVVCCVLVSWTAITERVALFYAMLLLLAGGCLGVFAARDLIIFYVFFEFTLIPLFFLIGIWGSEERQYAAIKFFLYTLAGSVITFLGLLGIVLWNYFTANTSGPLDFSIDALTNSASIDGPVQVWIFVALFIGFAVKVPLFPLHTWLPLAHVQAPTAGSVLLAGILLKIGTYGFVRLCLPILPQGVADAAPVILWLSVIGIIYGALVALAQDDIKRLIAYSSVSHLGFVMLGLFSLNRMGLEGAVLQMVNHGISTGALFAIVGMVYERYHTRKIAELGGLSSRTPILAFFMLLFTLSSIGLPGMNGFAGEFLILLGMFQQAFSDTTLTSLSMQVVAVLAVSGVVLGAWYMLSLMQQVFFGPLKEPHEEGAEPHAVADLYPREILALTPLAVLVFWIGLFPGYFLDPLHEPTSRIVQRLQAGSQARPASETAETESAPTSPANALTGRETDRDIR